MTDRPMSHGRAAVGSTREQVLVALDSLPHGGVDPLAWRIEQLVTMFACSNADVTVCVVGSAPSGVLDPAGATLHGAPVVYTGLDLDRFFAGNDVDYGIVVLAGGGTAHRLSSSLRLHQPHMTVVVDSSVLLSIQRPRLPDAQVRPEERGGRERIADLRRQRDAELLHGADVVWVLSQREADHVATLDAARVVAVVAPPRLSLTARGAGSGIVALAAPHREFGEPDLGAIIRLHNEIAPALGDDRPMITVVTERAVPLWAQRCPSLRFHERAGPLIDAIEDAAVVVIARSHGPTAWAQLLAATAVGVPIVATPESVRGLDDPAEWGIHVAAVEDLAGAVRSYMLQRRPSARRTSAPEPDVRPLLALGLEPGRADHAAEWLCGSRLSRRHVMDRHRYLRGTSQVALDPDPDTGADLAERPLISVLTPVYDTPLEVLDEMVASVRAQSYERWELCLVDDASTSNAVRERCRHHAAAEPRIVYMERSENGGIAAASNTALDSASGDFVALLDHDDLLRSDALLEMVRAINRFPDVDMLYSDEDKLFEDGGQDHSYAKAAWSPDLHLSYNYTCHFVGFRRELLNQLQGWRLGFDGAQDYDLALRVTERTDRIVHIPRNLYHWRVIEGSTAAGVDQKSDAWDAGRRSLVEAMERRGLEAKVEEGRNRGTYCVSYPVMGRPKVGVIIPTRDRIKMLSAAVDDLHDRTAWDELEIMVVDNESVEPDTIEWLNEHDGPIIDYPHQFSYARMMNLAAEQIDADLLLFLNNDVEVHSPGWITSMIGYAQQQRVGAVGARLLFPDGRVQHEGVVLGVGGVAGNVDSRDYFSLGMIERNCFSLTAACLMMRSDVFWEAGGFEERLRVAFNDVDLTMRVHQLGYDLVYTPQAELTHQESASRGSLHPEEDEAFFLRRWGPWEDYDDPYYNPRLSCGVQYLFADEVRQMWIPKSHIA